MYEYTSLASREHNTVHEGMQTTNIRVNAVVNWHSWPSKDTAYCAFWDGHVMGGLWMHMI